MLVRLTLKTLEDNIKDTVGVEVEVADDRLDHLDDVGGRHGRQVLVELGNQLCVTLALFPKQVELLLFVTETFYMNQSLYNLLFENPYKSFVFSLMIVVKNFLVCLRIPASPRVSISRRS